MKRGSEIIKEWEEACIADHNKNIVISLIVISFYPIAIGLAPFMVSENNRSVFTILLSMIFGHFLFIGLIRVIEQHGKMVRRERREWEQLEKRLRHKTKIQ